MPYTLAYYKEAVQDVAQAKVWYYNQQKGLERRFAADVKNAIIRLKTNPHVHTVRYKNIRVAHPDVFPYSIHFYIEEGDKRIVIVGVVHNNRDFSFFNFRQ